MTLALVTGATGFVGSAVVRELLAHGRQVRVLARSSSDRRNLEGLDLEVVEGDVRDLTAVARAVAGVDEIYHCAALFKYVWRREQDFYDTNVGGTSNVLRCARREGTARIVHTSTIAAVGAGIDGETVDETCTWNLGGYGDAYVESKRQAEVLALEHAQSGLPVVVVNPGGPLGPRDIAPTAGGRSILQVMRGHAWAWPPGTMSFVDVDDVAAGHRLAAERGRPGERYLLAAHNVTLRQFLELVADAAGVRPPRVPIPDLLVPPLAALEELRARILGVDALASRAIARMRHHTMWYDSSKARLDLGVVFRPLRESVARAVDWYRTQDWA